MSKMSKKTYYMIYSIVGLVFLGTGFFAGMHHEPWADEAQAWLMAKDSNSLMELIRAVRYEGTPALWHIIVKISQIMGLSYEHFFVLPLLFSTLGVVLLFCTKAPWYWKVLIPFTFYIVYQNSVIARSYCLVFPVMMLVTLFFEKGKEEPMGFYGALVLLALTSSYGIIVAGSFILYECKDILLIVFHKEYETKKKKLLGFFVGGFLVFLIGCMILPPADCMPIIGGKQRSIQEVSGMITNTFLFPMNGSVMAMVCALVLVGFFLIYCRKHIGQAIVYTLPLIGYLILMQDNIWHLTYLYVLVVALLIIFRKKENTTSYKIKESIVTALIALQCACGVFCVESEVKDSYSGSAQAVSFVKQALAQGATISAVDYHGTALQPYFEKNIFENRPGEVRYYIWSRTNHYIDKYQYEPKQLYDQIHSDLIVVQDFGEAKKLKFEGYRKIVFDGNMFYKFGHSDSTDMAIWVKKDKFPERNSTSEP